MANKVVQYSYSLLQISLVLAAGYHLAGCFYPINSASVPRHAAFVVIDVLCLYGFIVRPGYFVFLYGAFAVQQYLSHGRQLAHQWNFDGSIHWVSLFVLIILPIGLAALISDSYAMLKRELRNP